MPSKRDPPRLGVDGRRMPSYLLSCSDDAPRSTFSDGRGGPVTGLCNQLVVTSVVCSLSFRVPGSHPSTGATGSLLRATPGVTLHNELSTTAQASRCRHPSPRMAWRLVPPRQLWPCLFPLRAEAALVRVGSRVGLVSRERAEETQPLTPRVATWRRYRRTDTHAPPPEPFRPGSTKDPGFPRSGRLPSTGPVAHHRAPEGARYHGQIVTIPRLGRLGPSPDMVSR